MGVVVKGDLAVPPGASCQLVKVTVLGDVVVQPTATLTTSGNTVIAHDLLCAPGSTCTLNATSVGHDATCTAATCTFSTGTQVDHDVVATAGPSFQSEGLTVGHDFTCANQHCVLTHTTIGGEAELLRGPGVLDIYGSRMRELDCYGLAPMGGCNVYFNFFDPSQQPSVITGNAYAGPGAALSTIIVQIGGNLTCDACATLQVLDSTIDGHAMSDGGNYVDLCNDTIGGNLRISANRTYFASCDGDVINGNVQLFSNHGLLSVTRNLISGNLQLMDNRAEEMDIFNNQVRQNILCQNNVPPPIGTGNTAKRIDRDCGPIGVPLQPAGL